MAAVACCALIVVCAVVWLPVSAGLAGNVELLALLLLLARLVGRRAALLALLPGWLAVVDIDHRLADRIPASAHGRDVLVSGQVCSFPRRDANVTRFQFVTAAGARQAGVPARLSVAWYESAAPPAPGESWRLKLRLRLPRGLRNPGAGDAERHHFAAGVGARAYVRSSVLNRRLAPGGDRCPGIGPRAALADRLGAALGESPAAAYLLALTVGARHRLEPSDWELLRRTGTVHLMAISGLHIGLIAGLGFWAGRRAGRLMTGLGLRLSGSLSGTAVAVLAALAYAALAGFAVPTVRALLMVSAAGAAAALRRRSEPLELLASALFTVLLWQPLAPLGIGFWLSFAAVALLLMSSLGRRVGGEVRTGLRRFLNAQWRITLGLAPLGLFLFEQQSVVAPLANLVAIPLIGFAAVPLALAGLAVLPTGAGDCLVQLAAWPVLATLGFLEALAALPGAFWQPLPRAPWMLILAGAGCTLLLWPPPVPRRWLGACACLPLLLGGPPVSREALRVIVMDVGQGLAVLVQTRRHNLLYDTGPSWGSGDAGAAVVLPVLRRYGVARLDRLLVSHGDSDHAGGLRSLRRFFAGVPVWAPAGQLSDADSFCRAGQAWTWDGVRFRILAPVDGSASPSRSDNDSSCVLQIRSGGGTVLLTGDIGHRTERALVRTGRPLAARLVVAPHHGSATSSGAELVAATGPRYLIVSAGFRNRWGFPAREVVRRWQDGGACVLNTADWGALEFGSAGDEPLALQRAERVAAGRLWNYPPPPRGPCARGSEPL